MKLGITLMILGLVSFGCAPSGNTHLVAIKGEAGKPCTVQQTTLGALITCEDGSSSFIPNGAVGAPGVPGDSVVGAPGLSGPQGETGSPGQSIVGQTGPQGDAGVPGLTGPGGATGSNGHSAAFAQYSAGPELCPAGGTVINAGVDLNDDTTLQMTETTQTIPVCHGISGADGSDGVDGDDAPISPYAITEVIAPCGGALAFSEVLLRMSNGQLIAHYASGNKQFLTILTPGNYVLTDGSNCHFNVSNTGVVTW